MFDAAMHFFQDCYHIKDWILHDTKSTIPPEDVKSFILRDGSLRLCHDLAVGAKHLTVGKTMRVGQPDQSKVVLSTIHRADMLPVGLEHMFILVCEEAIDLFILSSQCMNAWATFLAAFGITHEFS